MATWLIHLLVAEKCERALAPALAPENIADYTVGALAPDCGKMLDFKVYEPTADITHWAENGRKRSSDYKGFYDKMLRNKDVSESDRAFLLGYFVHLATDNLWFQLFMQRIEKMYLKAPEDKRALYGGINKDLWEFERLKIQSGACSYAELLKGISHYSNSTLHYLSDELLIDRVKGTNDYFEWLKNECAPHEMHYTSVQELDKTIDMISDEIIRYLGENK